MIKSNKSIYTKSCHPEFISGSTPLVAIQNKEEMLKQVQHDMRSEEMLKLFHETPYYNLTGRGPKVMAAVQDDFIIKTNRGFTLIELLVVVLIIGILAAVAVPQYKKAVQRSRNTQLKAVLNTIVQAEKVYFLANGKYAANFKELDVDLPLEAPQISGYFNGTNSVQHPVCGFAVAGPDSVRRGKGFDIILNATNPATGVVVKAFWISGTYKCTGFSFGLSGIRRCVELTQKARINITTPGDFCEKIEHGVNKTINKWKEYFWDLP